MTMALDETLQTIKRFIPTSLFSFVQPGYHWVLAFVGAVLYGFPSRYITVIGVTGTKGKSSTAEFVNAIFQTSGHTTALASTIRVKIAGESTPNLRKMTLPGRFFLQRFLHDAIQKGCDTAIVEMTSEGVKQYRHLFINMDALIFTNLSPEHIESHGSFEKYAQAKLQLGEALVKSPKRPRILVANSDDAYGAQFLALPVDVAAPFSLSTLDEYTVDEQGAHFRFDGVDITSALPGAFMLENAAAAAVLAHRFGIKTTDIKKGIESLRRIPGRAESIKAGQGFSVIVDYAHTPDSLRALCSTYASHDIICILGSTGGGRDVWKRPEMGKIAEQYCSHVLLTNEDPYDEDPEKIVSEIASGMTTKEPEIIMDRREAIRRALSIAKTGNVVLITGKGTDPYIMGPRGKKTPWSDMDVAQKELKALVDSRKMT